MLLAARSAKPSCFTIYTDGRLRAANRTEFRVPSGGGNCAKHYDNLLTQRSDRSNLFASPGCQRNGSNDVEHRQRRTTNRYHTRHVHLIIKPVTVIA